LLASGSHQLLPPGPGSVPRLGRCQAARVRTLNGRIDKRFPIAVVVYLGQVQDRTVKETELTCTDNISVNGARVISRRPWQPNELVQLTPLKDETSIRGKVVHCQKLEDDRYLIGVNIQGLSAKWPSFRIYSGA